MGSIMSGPSKRPTGTPRPKDEILRHAKHFFDQYFSSIKRMNSPSHVRRWKEIVSEVESSGTYELKETELVYGAKLAWRNAPRCIGRIQWSKLQNRNHCLRNIEDHVTAVRYLVKSASGYSPRACGTHAAMECISVYQNRSNTELVSDHNDLPLRCIFESA
ncbi:nitric oxide synthase, salivary gland [Nephila pilipes]|uniref:nitric-oxide synthase (NADPH) n=1 Tax=Nephila pilipes TaxID=299642 RepID=A0A8X6NA06_NEPPI|nr:nitric oxide synthase, salivary gland [Nephila pilipes]